MYGEKQNFTANNRQVNYINGEQTLQLGGDEAYLQGTNGTITLGQDSLRPFYSRLNGRYTITNKMAFTTEEKIKCAVIFEQTKSAMTVRRRIKMMF